MDYVPEAYNYSPRHKRPIDYSFDNLSMQKSNSDIKRMTRSLSKSGDSVFNKTFSVNNQIRSRLVVPVTNGMTD